MGKIAVFLLLFFTLQSCNRDESPVEINPEGNAIIFPKNAVISEAEEVPWRVGLPKRADTVSKGIRLKISLPYFDHDKLMQVMEKHDITGWLVSVYRQTATGGVAPLGMVYAPILHKIESRVDFRQVDFVVVDIFYTAAYISRAHENLPCPVDNHQKRVTNVRISDRTSFSNTISVRSIEEQAVYGKIPEASIIPYNFNGGKDLLGSFFVEIAFYNHLKNLRKSSFYSLPNTVTVLGEREVPIMGCKGREGTQLNQETESREEKIKKFKLTK